MWVAGRGREREGGREGLREGEEREGGREREREGEGWRKGEVNSIITCLTLGLKPGVLQALSLYVKRYPLPPPPPPPPSGSIVSIALGWAYEPNKIQLLAFIL